MFTIVVELLLHLCLLLIQFVFTWMQMFPQLIKGTSNGLDKAGSPVDRTLMHEDSAVVEPLQVTFWEGLCQMVFIYLLKKMLSLVSSM